MESPCGSPDDLRIRCGHYRSTVRAGSRRRRLVASGSLSGEVFRSESSLGGTMGRVFGFLGLIIAVGVGMYIYSQSGQSSSAAAGANNPKAAINITGVRSDLTSIAQVGRRYYASE